MKINNISFKNLLSYGNKSTVHYFDTTETVLISGKNGAGKTTLIDAIHYNLTGKSYRKINIGQFINSKNKKMLLTEGNYTSSTGTKVKIIRGRKDDIFDLYVNDKKQDQSLSKDFQTRIETILEFNPKNLEKLFLISSTSYKPFLSSSPDEKRKLIDQLIEIESFTKMSDSIKKDRTIEKEKLREIEFQIEKLKSNIEIIEEFNKKIDNTETSNTTNDIKKLDLRTKEIIKEVEKIKASKVKNQEKLDGLNESTNKLLSKSSKQVQAINDMRSRIGQLEATVRIQRSDWNEKSTFFNQNDSCVTCDQEIGEQHKEKVTWEIEQQILELDEKDHDIEEENKKLTKYIALNDELVDTIKINQSLIDNIVNEVTKDADKLTQMKYEYKSILSQISTLKSSLTKSIEKRDSTDIVKELNEQYEKRIKSTEHLDVIETSIKMLGEKYLRSFSIDRYLPALNKNLDKYLDIFGLPFKIVLDNEFKEKFLSKDYAKLSYNSLSEGEKKRVDLSLIFSFFDISSLRSKQTSNILVMDEIADSSLDIEAISGLSHIINQLTEQKITVIIISHNDDIKNSIDFTKQLEVTKEGSFSTIKEI